MKFKIGERLRIVLLCGGNGGGVEVVDGAMTDLNDKWIEVEVEVAEAYFDPQTRLQMKRRATKLRRLNLSYVTSINEWYEPSKG